MIFEKIAYIVMEMMNQRKREPLHIVPIIFLKSFCFAFFYVSTFYVSQQFHEMG